MFPDLTQKAKSGLLKFLWQNDPFKAKWAILAKAYSIIRDDHVGEVSLDSFLNLNANILGIIVPEAYLTSMGWELSVDGQSQYTMARVKPSAATEADVSTNYSVNDIVARCYDMGYVSENKRVNKPNKDHNGPVMAFAAQPTLIANENNGIQLSGNSTIVDCDSNENFDVEVSPAESTADSSSPDTSDTSMMGPENSRVPNRLPLQLGLDTQRKQENCFNANTQYHGMIGTGYHLPVGALQAQLPLFDYDPNYDLLMSDSLDNYDIDWFLNF